MFKTKTDLALELFTRAVDDKLPGEILLVDAAYGGSSEFRNTVRVFGFDLGIAMTGSTKVWALDTIERRRGDPVSVQALGIELGTSAFRRITWREGTRRKMSSRFCFGA